MLSFEEKKAAFHSFKLKEKKISNGRVNFVYPESRQKGQVLATQLHPSGNGYVIGKYMTEETIKHNGYKVDSRGWISIRKFTRDELTMIISEAIKSMSGGELLGESAQVEKQPETPEKPVEIKQVPSIDKTAISHTYEKSEFPCLNHLVELTESLFKLKLVVWKNLIGKIAKLS